nr:MAG TPA: Septum formation initiator [Caudoviricetes sp.]
MSFLLKILGSKWTYIALFILAIFIVVLIFINTIQNYEETIDDLEEHIDNLEMTNKVLYKELQFQNEKLEILKSYSNSTKIIDSLEDNRLIDVNIEAVITISNDYYNSFTNQ